jgi:polysaccharide deacetylase 2 family uncharacterized protein YibQ
MVPEGERARVVVGDMAARSRRSHAYMRLPGPISLGSAAGPQPPPEKQSSDESAMRCQHVPLRGVHPGGRSTL